MVLISSLRGLVPFSFLSITIYRKTFIFVKKKSNAFWKEVKSATFIKAMNLAMNRTAGQAAWAYCAVSVSLKIRPLDCSRAYRCIILYGNVEAVMEWGSWGMIGPTSLVSKIRLTARPAEKRSVSRKGWSINIALFYLWYFISMERFC
jgi:hypothetical protein